MNRYSGEIHINPIAILRDNDFNNDGEIADIKHVLERTLELNQSISERINRLQNYLESHPLGGDPQFSYAPGGYIQVSNIPDTVLIDMKSKNLIDLFDWATDKDWVKRFGKNFGLMWENGRAVPVNN